MRRRRSICLASLILTLLAHPAASQSIPIPEILDRGIDGLFGKPDRAPGAYVSPSANELVPPANEVGLPQMRALKRLDPIALPEQTMPGIAPNLSAIDLPNLPAYAPQRILPDSNLFRPNGELILEARLTTDGQAVPGGVRWRVFSAVPSLDGKPLLVASSQAASPSFDLPPGAYIVHASFGRAGVVQRIDFSGVSTRETVVLGAGGLKLEATGPEGSATLNGSRLKFDVFATREASGERELVASGVSPGEVLRLNAGLYHVVSRYGAVNAKTQADIKVEPGRITEATLRHRAAYLTMKLVREKGGEAIADTAWTVTSMSGDVLRESVGAFPSMVLAEGEYMIVARNRDRIYQRAFTVKAGEDSDVEVMYEDLADPALVEGTGD